MGEILFVHLIAGAALYKDGKFLLVQEKLPKAYGQWNWPAGKVETGLSLQENAQKEVKEETGFDVHIDELVGIFPKLKKEEEPQYLYRATILGGELIIPEDEILDARWFTVEEMVNLELRDPWVISGAKMIISKVG